MHLHIAKWGNSLALRLPAVFLRTFAIKEGDRVQVNITVDGSINIRAAKWDRKAFADELKIARDEMPMGQSVIEELRRAGRY